MAAKKTSKGQMINRNLLPNLNDNFYERFRPKPKIEVKTNVLVALIIFSFTLITYWITQNRSVTFWDVGEYIACSSILGVPHPPGNPLYIIIGRTFALLGLGLPHALVVNSISGLMSALAVMFTYLFTVKLVSMFESNKSLIITAGIIAALYNAFSFTFWNNAVEASVYPARDLVINSTIYLTLLWVEKSRNLSHQNILLVIVYIFFLGFSIHQTALQTVPAVLFIVLYPIFMANLNKSSFWIRAVIYFILGLIIYFTFIEVGKNYDIPDLAKIATGIYFFIITYIHLRDRISNKAWLLGIIFVAIALSPHLFLLIRSALRPFINEGHPHNLELFSDYVLRRQYGVVSFLERRATAYYQFTHHFLRYFFWQFFHADTIAGWIKMPSALIATLARLVVLFLGFFGIWFQAKKNKHSFIYLLSFFLMSSFAMIFVMNLSDAEVRNRDYFFVSAYYLWGVWMAIGSIGLIKLIAGNKSKLVKPLILAFLFLPILNFTSQYVIHDRSEEFIALDYGLNFLNSLEENAIIFTNGDNDTFPLWYAQAVYDPNAFENIYPATDIYSDQESEKAVLKAVARKKNELSGIRPDVTVANLSLLNTPWYIRHLRDIEGVLFNIPDRHIDDIRPMRSDRPRQITISSPNNEDSFTINIPPNKPLLIKDIAAIQIIRDNYGRRPLYMAVTVADEIVFHDFLRNEGKVNRIVSREQPNQTNIERLKNNLKNVYSYRSIFDDSVYKDENMRNLITNYGAAYMRVSQYYHRKDDLNKAADYLAKAIRFIQNNTRFYPSLVQMYIEAENSENALKFIDKILTEDPQDIRFYMQAATIHIEEDNIDQAFDVFEKAISHQVTASEIISFIYYLADHYHEYTKGIEALTKISEYDDSPALQKFISNLMTAKDSLDNSITPN